MSRFVLLMYIGFHVSLVDLQRWTCEEIISIEMVILLQQGRVSAESELLKRKWVSRVFPVLPSDGSIW